MTSFIDRALAIAVVAACVSTSDSHAAPAFEVFYAEDFSAPSSLSEWSIDDSAGGAVVWNASDGSPAPGSLALITQPGDVVSTLSPCFAFDPSQRRAVSVRLKPVQTSGSLCAFETQMFSTPNCSGSPTFFNHFAGTGAPETWALEVHDLLLPEDVPVPGVHTQAMRLRFEHGSSSASSCLFDEVRVRGTTTAIPMLGNLALWVLVALLGIAGYWTMRRSRFAGGHRISRTGSR